MDPAMSNHASAPPPCLDNARVIFYAILDASVTYSGRTLLFVDGKELGRVPRLAICQDRRLPGVMLFHCDDEWTVLGCSGHDSVESAKRKAKAIYLNIEDRWVDGDVTEADAERYLDELLQDYRCSSCGKRADQVDRLQTKGKSYVCDKCRLSGQT
jgi:predicted RNA-binding Zn-ribbon protein involved in translation (DUF1610 family)